MEMITVELGAGWMSGNEPDRYGLALGPAACPGGQGWPWQT